MKKAERAKHMKNWLQSGQTKKAYSELAGIKYATFISWFKKSGNEQVGRFVKLEKTKQSSGLEIVFSNGIRLYSEEVLSLDLLKMLQNV